MEDQSRDTDLIFMQRKKKPLRDASCPERKPVKRDKKALYSHSRDLCIFDALFRPKEKMSLEAFKVRR